jgi:PAS domain S-box-containing protein
MTPEDAARGYPTCIRGVVTYYNLPERDLFIQDSTAGIWVDSDFAKPNLHAGEFVEVEGVSATGDFAPEIVRSRFRNLGEAPMPRPARPSSDELASGRQDSQWIEVQGVVRSAAERDGGLVLNFSAGAFECRVFVLKYPSPLPGIIDAHVLIRGVFSGLYDSTSNRFIGFQILTPSWDNVQVLKRPPQAQFSLPVRPIPLFLRLTPEGAFTHRVHVRGTVLFQQTGLVSVRDQGQALWVRTTQSGTLKAGDLIDAVGFPAIGDFTPVMRDAIVQKIGSSPAPAPVAAIAEQLQAGAASGDLVRLSARLLNHTARPGEEVLELQAGELNFRAELSTGERTAPLNSIRNGSLVRLTGVSLVEADENRQPKGFRILLRTPDDVVLLQSPSWWTRSRITGLVMMLAGIILLSALWVAILRRRVEERTKTLRASEERYRELFENASDLVFTTDMHGRLTSLNKVAEQTLGYSREEATRKALRQLVDAKHWERVEGCFERLLRGESTVQFEIEIMTKDGGRAKLEVKPRLIFRDGQPVGVQGIGRDITGRDVAEMELRQAQKLESVGRLAAGIAHEINTPIQFVGDNTRFLQDAFASLGALHNKLQELLRAVSTQFPELLKEMRRAEEELDAAFLLKEIPKALNQSLEGVTRVATIVRAMKEFAHPESKDMAAADLNKALLSTLTVARNELKYVADVETDFGDLPLVVCNLGDMNQVFLNLLVNAAHAVGDVMKETGKKGKISVRTQVDGSMALIAIADTGGGIPDGIRSRIFDPFFTTKEVGRGTGQGLAIARSVVVDRHKGTLTYESDVGKGTTFYVRLPLEPADRPQKVQPAMAF